jgi:hypothetical protein
MVLSISGSNTSSASRKVKYSESALAAAAPALRAAEGPRLAWRRTFIWSP